MADASKRIDLAAPLLSVRRHGGLGMGGVLRYRERCDDAAPGAVPFGWERRPGHPKGVCTTQSAPPLSEPDQQAAERFSDALSRPDSCYTVNCSDAAGATASASASAAPSPRGSVMMDRFLLAAKEQCVFRKAAAAANTRAPTGERLPRRLPVQHLPADHARSNSAREDTNKASHGDGGDEWEVHSTAGFASKRKCGLLPTRCAKSALLLLHPSQSMARRRRGARRFMSDCGRCRRETSPLLPQPLKPRPEHDADMRTWEEVYISSMLRSDRACSLRRQATMASELDRTVRGLYTGKAGAAVHPKATHLGMLLVLDRTDGDAVPPPKCGRPPTAGIRKAPQRRDAAVGHGFPPPLPQAKTPARRDNMLLALPSPKMPSESWLSRTLPAVPNRRPTTSFMGIHVQQLRKQHAPSRWCSSDQAKIVDHGARARQQQIRIYDLHK
ncbi:uncharacterized protein LOC123416393 [Hordeum vulgare subsp. vulgare]|uniref:Uncharacterized protein n=1 Tax=Hordeum vulgare subsp. vulgare TaxID=112509 RepID=A0A8I6WWE6_HORVV|nr:uncharacterized protein LOC123416393 [Hordeum vulgare subsp. vulgare]KAI5019509.1 hypothetical protein ZWY2020_044397 [Hordeum vulgare]